VEAAYAVLNTMWVRKNADALARQQQ